MTDETREMPVDVPEPNDTNETRAVRRRTVTFLAIFLVSVSVLLVGYQFIVNSQLNRWYLFQVARNTAWALNFFGEESELEYTRHTMDVPRARETLDAWANGEPTPTTFHPEKYAGAVLTPWESWKYRSGLLLETRGLSLHNEGPFVRFVQRESYQKQIQDVNAEISRLSSANAGADEADQAKRAELEHRLESLQEARTKLPKNEAGQPVDPRRAFTFRVVAECGAIEAMAIFFSAVLAFPTRWWKRIAGIIVGLPLLYCVNILRLTCLGYIGAWDNGGEIFSFAHEYVWQGLYIIFVVAIWLLWVELLVRRAP